MLQNVTGCFSECMGALPPFSMRSPFGVAPFGLKKVAPYGRCCCSCCRCGLYCELYFSMLKLISDLVYCCWLAAAHSTANKMWLATRRPRLCLFSLPRGVEKWAGFTFTWAFALKLVKYELRFFSTINKLHFLGAVIWAIERVLYFYTRRSSV